MADPSAAVLTTMARNWSSLSSRPSVLRVSWKFWPAGGRWLAEPARGDLDVLFADGADARRRPSCSRAASFCGSSQMRML